MKLLGHSAQTVFIPLQLDFVSNKWYFPKTPTLDNKIIIGIETLTSQDLDKNIFLGDNVYATIIISQARNWHFNIYEKGHENPIIENMPYLSCKKMSNVQTGNNRIPGANIKPFHFEIDTERSYVKALNAPFQPYFLAFIFYTKEP